MSVGVSNGCPDSDQLELLANGSHTESGVWEHVEQCSKCRAVVEDIRDNSSFLDQMLPLLKRRPAVSVGLTPEDTLPGYQIIGELHRGGQGIVYKAIQTAAKRTVAIKMLLHGSLATARERYRFEREFEIVANLRHTNIVAVYEHHKLPGGRPAFAMEYVEGVRLDEWMADLPLTSAAVDVKGGRLLTAVPPSSPRQRREIGRRPSTVGHSLRIFTKICDAVSYAHQRGVIHRDLKPANILVDAAGEPHILDFGLAKMAARPALAGERTLTGDFLGTFDYAAPEQVLGKQEQVDTRTDVYALGVILYELLTSRRPYPPSSGLPDAIRHVTDTPPPPPSAVNAAVGGELDTIVAKALAKEPQRRYESAGALLADIRHFLAGEPIDAKRDSPWYVLRKTARQYRAPLAVGAVILLLLAVLTVKTAIDAGRIKRERDAAELARQSERGQRDAAELARQSERGQREEAESNAERARNEAAKAQAVNQFLQNILGSVDPRARGRDVTVRQILDEASRTLEGGWLAEHAPVEAAVRRVVGVMFHKLGAYDAADPHLRRALWLRRAALADDVESAAELVESLDDLAKLLIDVNQLAESQQLFDEAMNIQRQSHAGDLHRLKTNLAGLLKEKGDYAGAEALYTELLNDARQVYGETSPQAALAMNNLGGLHNSRGDFTRAERLFREALQIHRDSPADAPAAKADEAKVLNNLAMIVQARGDAVAAEPLYVEALEKYRTVHGNEHPVVVRVINNLATVKLNKGDLVGAEPLMREALELRRKLLGPDHPEVAEGLNNLAVLMNAKGDRAAAESLHHEALALRRRALGDDHPDTLGSMNNLGVILRDLGQLDESESLLREALDRSHTQPNVPKWQIGNTQRHLGDCLLRQARLDEAETELLSAAQILEETLGAEHDRTRKTWQLLVTLYQSSAKPDRAAEYQARLDSPAGPKPR